MKGLFVGAMLVFLLTSCVSKSPKADEPVTLKSMLEMMTDRDARASFPAHEFQNKQFSSYSRRAVSPEEGWFSNWDWSNFLRVEQNQGRTEYVMYDHEGPGSIVRFWMTFAKGSHNGVLRIYLDGSETPIMEGKAMDILGANQEVGSPLSSSSSELTHKTRRGHNLYLPIPYAKSCKVTIETPTLKGEMDEFGHVEGSFVYYNINYREYAEGTQIETVTKEVLAQNKALIDSVNKSLLVPTVQRELNSYTMSHSLEGGKAQVIEIDGEQAIKEISVELNARDRNQALRSTVLAIEFDGKETVWVPMGDFFGIGYKISPYKSFYTEVNEEGVMKASWVMPFQENAKVSFINLGDQHVYIDASIGVDKFEWTDESLYFYASWFEKNRIQTVEHSGPNPHVGTGAEDINFVTIDGKGVFIGDTLTLFNSANSWWGEGDEKIYVDGEDFPSHFGTGTEDYYGYAWCRPEKFHTPFITQPDGSGNLRNGFSVNSRYRLLDGIPFTKSFKFDMELWHWKKATMNYAPTVFYYATAGSESNAIKDVENAKAKVLTKLSDLYPPVMKDGKIEGEIMEVVRKTGGHASPQSLQGWSGNSHGWWTRG